MNRLALRLVICFLVGALIFGGIGDSSIVSHAQTKPSVVASFFPVWEFTRVIAQDRVNLDLIVQAGFEAHDYEPTFQDIEKLQNAKMFAYNGSGVEDPWVKPLLENGTLDPNRQVIVQTTQLLQEGGLLLAAPPPDDQEFSSDPHVWLDPIRAQEIVRTLEEGLIKLDPTNSDFYNNSGQSYRGELAVLHTDTVAALQNCKHKAFVTSHRFMAYFADRYGLQNVTAAGIEPEEPEIQALEAVIEFVKENNIKYIFTESLDEAEITGINRLAEATGAQILLLNSVEEPEKEGASYLDLMRENLNNLKIGLECGS